MPVESVAAEMNRIEQIIRGLEEQLLRPDVRKSPAALGRILADDFVEIGSSGRMFDKPTVIHALALEVEEPRHVLQDFKVNLVAPTVALTTFRTVHSTALNEPKHALRSSIWVCRDGTWQIVFHQGTAMFADRAVSAG